MSSNPGLYLFLVAVFVRGKSIGGGDDTAALQSQGKLVPLLKDANALKAVTPA